MVEVISQQLKREFIGSVHALSSHGFTVGFDFIEGVPASFFSTFEGSWLGFYQDQDLVASDPVVIWGSENVGVASWNELQNLYPSQKVDVIGLARSYGMKNGSVLSMTVNRRKAIIGVTHDQETLTSDEEAVILGQMARVCLSMTNDAPNRLTYKAQQYLSLVSKGKTDADISEQMGVTKRAVYALRARALEKLEVNSLSQAILKAHQVRLID